MSVCNVCISKIPRHQKKVSDPLRNHKIEYLLTGTTFVWGTNRGGTLSQGQKQEPHEEMNFIICFAGPPQQITVFSRQMVRRGVTPGPMWQRDISQGLLPPPRKISLEGELWWQTSTRSQSGFSCPCPSQGNRKSVWISISHCCASMAWPRDPGTHRQEKETKPTSCKPPVLLSAWWLSLWLLINISQGKRSQQNVIWRRGVKREGMQFYCFENCTLEELNIGKCQELKMKCLKVSFYVVIYSLSVQWKKNHIQSLIFSFRLRRGKKFSSQKFSKGEKPFFSEVWLSKGHCWFPMLVSLDSSR